MENKLVKFLLPFLLFLVACAVFFRAFLIQGNLPIPSDTIVGLYNPFRDFYSQNYPNGIPFKNFLITDPVRQQYPWRFVSVSSIKNINLPLWNPYSFSGTPLLANMQSAAFYPLNILFAIFPFSLGWSLLVVLEPLLAGAFMYFYLKNLKLGSLASFLGGFVFAFCGFNIAWMEWNTVVHAVLWTPLILLSVDRIFDFYEYSNNSKFKIQNSKLQLKNKKLILWCLILVFSTLSSFLAGHLQVFVYVFLLSIIYFFARWIQSGKNFAFLFVFLIFYLLFLILTSIQWLPGLQFILDSARNIDQNWQQPGWFIPWQNLVQFIAPDFFGNPATLNYWGVWNYAEFIGYIGIIPLIMAIYALFLRHDKKTLFFGSVFFVSLLFALPTIFGQLPFILKLPLVSTSQPTRLLSIIDFSLAVLTALGIDYFFKTKKNIWSILVFFALLFGLLWGFVFLGGKIFPVQLENIMVAKSNLLLPSAIFALSVILLFLLSIFKKSQSVTRIIRITIIIVVVFDLFRFGWKFTPFTNKQYLFPQTQTLTFLEKNTGSYRIMTTDNRILPPNFSVIYKLQSVDGYDPLYLLRYGELMAASERGKADISTPFGFNRIITPHNYNSSIISLLGVKYVLSLSDINLANFKKVFQEGQTRVYENKNVMPRAFFAKNLKIAKTKEDAIEMLFQDNLSLVAIVENASLPQVLFASGMAKIVDYQNNKAIINTENKSVGFLVLTDSFYPTWHATIDGKETKIYRADYNFRGIIIPGGNHTVEFYDTLL